MELHTVPLEIPTDANVILGQSHFIKTVEDLHEIVVGSCPQAKFGLAFCEASGPCLIRVSGNDAALVAVVTRNAQAVAAGHTFHLLLQGAYPINVLNAIKLCPEVCRIFCATANPVQVIVAQTDQGRGILGVIDGFLPQGVERSEDVQDRHHLLRQIGYKL
ncbi:MAG: adenosine-specific kinase [Synechococcales cyanobacterium]